MIELQEKPKGTALERFILGLVAHRMSLWFWLTLAGVVAIWFVAAHQVNVLLWKAVLLTSAAYLGYWIARQLEKGKRPHEIFEEARLVGVEGDADRRFQLESLADSMLKRRTAIICAAMLASALGT